MKVEKIAAPGADIRLIDDAFADPAGLFTQLMAQTPWKSEDIILFGKRHTMPRLTCWMGEAAYSYSGLLNMPQPCTPVVREIGARVGEICGVSFNGVLLNLYRDGRDSMGWHADDEAALGPDPVIASVSLGARRRFRFRPKAHHPAEAFGLDLSDGSVLIMQGGTQANWQHAIPKTARQVGPRINLTFRKIVD